MTDLNSKKNIYSLFEVLQGIQETLANRFGSAFWIKAEMNKLNYYPHSGHCYPELVEKRDGKVIAQVRGTIWREDYQRINETFMRVLQEPLRNGINILFLAKIVFDPQYGLSLRIQNIDPSWSLGELEREKQETILKLKEEGIFTQNKNVPLPFPPRRIAVISVETSRGFADFSKVIAENTWGYRFFMMLFPAILQGDKVTESIGFQLDRIAKVKHHFDLVAIIRGGGDEVGLSGYNKWSIARKVALFPLPVITGIGHATNETVVEMVAHKNCITPTDLANFLIQQFHNAAIPLSEASKILSEGIGKTLMQQRHALLDLISHTVNSTRNDLTYAGNQISNSAERVLGYTGYYLRNAREELVRQKVLAGKESHDFLKLHANGVRSLQNETKYHAAASLAQHNQELEGLQKQVSLLDPRNVLARGYSITLQEGEILRGISAVNPGDTITTITFDGSVESTVTHVHPEQD